MIILLFASITSNICYIRMRSNADISYEVYQCFDCFVLYTKKYLKTFCDPREKEIVIVYIHFCNLNYRGNFNR